MKKAKIVKTDAKQKMEIENDTYSVKDLIKITLVLVVVFAIFYFITVLVVKPTTNSASNDTFTVIDSTKITLNHLLDRSEEEYYVLATKQSLYNSYVTKINYLEIYNNYILDYKRQENSLKFYIVDLDDALNKNYIGEFSNITSDLSNLKLNDEVLFKIKDGVIEDYYVGKDNIISLLSNL